MDQVLAYVVTAIASVGAVKALIAKSKIGTKYLSLATEVIQFVDALLKSLEDKTLTEEEVKRLASKGKEIKEAYNLIKK